MRIFAYAVLFASIFAAPDFASAKVKTWRYSGVEHSNGALLAFTAKSSVSDNVLTLRYYPKNGRVDLTFTYRGSSSFSDSKADKATFFMRTRIEPKLGGRYSSDYIFKGKTIAVPNTSPNKPQYVVATLAPGDIDALQKYEKNKIIGVEYFTEQSGWSSYTLSSIDVWSSYQRLKREAAALRSGQRLASPPPLPKKQRPKKDVQQDAAFANCAKRVNERSAVNARISDMQSRAKYVMDDLRAARRLVDEREAEYKRLEKIASIMQSSDEVWRKYRTAVAGYNDSVKKYRKLNGYVGDQKRVFDQLQQRRAAMTKKLTADCYKSWPSSTIQRNCKAPSSKNREFCSAFKKR